jgi:AraC family transcriptional regulator, positive regulator of tynA and feaB
MAGEGAHLERYSTVGLSQDKRLAYWNNLVCETYNNLVIDADSRSFSAEMLHAPLGELTLMSAHSAAASVSRRNDPHRAARGLGVFDLHFQLAGRSINSQAGREAVLETGDFTLCDASRPYSVRFTEANHMLCIKVPAAAMVERLGDVERLICLPMQGRQGAGAMLSSFLTTMWGQIDQAGDKAWAETVSQVVLDLLGLAYRPLQEASSAASAQALQLARARAFIDERICDPELGVSSIAEALGVSSRYIQMLFASEGSTPSAYILERRLRLAAERLRRADGRGVTDVAMAVGFNDLTHFGRVFRRRYGVAPRDYREGARAPRGESGLADADPRTRVA